MTSPESHTKTLRVSLLQYFGDGKLLCQSIYLEKVTRLPPGHMSYIQIIHLTLKYLHHQVGIDALTGAWTCLLPISTNTAGDSYKNIPSTRESTYRI